MAFRLNGSCTCGKEGSTSMNNPIDVPIISKKLRMRRRFTIQFDSLSSSQLNIRLASIGGPRDRIRIKIITIIKTITVIIPNNNNSFRYSRFRMIATIDTRITMPRLIKSPIKRISIQVVLIGSFTSEFGSDIASGFNKSHLRLLHKQCCNYSAQQLVLC